MIDFDQGCPTEVFLWKILTTWREFMNLGCNALLYLPLRLKVLLTSYVNVVTYMEKLKIFQVKLQILR